MLIPGRCLKGRYCVDALIATGGYASVYRVTDTKIATTRAMKEVTDPDPGIREQFLLEANLLRTSNHPNIPRGHEHFEENGCAYLVMDFVEGQDLEQVLATSLMQTGRPLEEAHVLRWLMPICDALDEMHNRPVPVIHRDIKPANIKLTAAGVPILIDFGLAKFYMPGPTNAAAQGVTPGYAPPEQYLAQGKTDARSDIYGMGATMYTLLTGKEPPEAPNRLLAQTGKTGEPMVPPRILNPLISAATAHIIDRAMDVGAAQRHQSALELRDDIAASLAQLEMGRPYYTPGESTKPLPFGLVDTLQFSTATVSRSAMPANLVAPPPPPPLITQVPTIKKPSQVAHPWFDLGGPLLRRMGKVGLVFSAIEMYWGLLCASALTVVVGTDEFRSNPSVPIIAIGVALLAVFGVLTVVLVRAVDRPIARRGRISGFQRGVQASILLILWILMNTTAALFLNALSAEIGLIGLGLLGFASILNGLLSVANILA